MGDEQSKQVICKEGVRVNQAATTACGDILIQTPFKELGFAFSREADDVEVSRSS